ncbi:MAG: endonuclease/exonuclease/phosphatase family protein [Lachnospiraceae bacterium]|nr:endonuclease/exonuclease/phosphatase family protein [Lachnospiraceae bacterium]
MKKILLYLIAFTLLATTACGNASIGTDVNPEYVKIFGEMEDVSEQIEADEDVTEVREVSSPALEDTNEASEINYKSDKTEATIMCYNIFYQNAEARAPLIEALILEKSPDIIGVQELSLEWVSLIQDFKEAHQYSSYGYGRHGGDLSDENLGSSEQFALILWKTDKYELTASGHFWASSTPDVVRSTAWADGTNTTFPRCINWVKLKDKTTGSEMIFLNLHLAPEVVNYTVRTNSSKLIIEKMEEFYGNYPIVLTGDFNMKLTCTAYETITQNGYNDMRFTAEQTDHRGSFNNWTREMDALAFADHIFGTPDIIVESYEVIDHRVDGEHISDHNPLFAKIFF